jgi:hypothetical protein
MKVKLFKQEEVEFNLPDEKCEKISHSLFRSLTGYVDGEHPANDLPKMVVFKTKEEYQAEAHKYGLDLTKEVLINAKGNIFCYLKGEDTVKTQNKSEETADVTTNTEEN